MTRRALFGSVVAAISSLFASRAVADASRKTEVITARSPNGWRTQVFYRGALESRACAACPSEGWFDRFVLEDDADGGPRTLPRPSGGVLLNRGRRGGVMVRNGQLVTERIHGSFELRDRVSGSRTFVLV